MTEKTNVHSTPHNDNPSDTNPQIAASPPSNATDYHECPTGNASTKPKKKGKYIAKASGATNGHPSKSYGQHSSHWLVNTQNINSPDMSPNKHDNDRIWSSVSNAEERQKIREFWLLLGEDKRRSLVKKEKEAVLRKMKEQQKHSCNCSVCGKKRNAIEDELEGLYDAYYEELEQYANHQQQTCLQGKLIPFMPPEFRKLGSHGSNLITKDDANTEKQPSRNENQQVTQDNDKDWDDSEREEDQEHDYEHPSDHSDGISEIVQRKISLTTYSGGKKVHISRTTTEQHFDLGNSLTVKGGIITVADDLLKNDGKRFLDMMERLAERRMQNEEQFGIAEDEAYLPHDDDEVEIYEDEEEETNEDDDDDDDDDDENSRGDEERIEDGRRMFQIFAARMFEQRILTAYREKVANERQQRLIEELEEEERLRKEKELKKQQTKERRRDKKRQLKQLKEEQRLAEEAKRKAEEAAAQAEKERKLELERQKRELERQKREEERQRKEEEKRRRIKEERERILEKERKRKEKEEKERRLRETREQEKRKQQQKEQSEAQKATGENAHSSSTEDQASKITQTSAVSSEEEKQAVPRTAVSANSAPAPPAVEPVSDEARQKLLMDALMRGSTGSTVMNNTISSLAGMSLSPAPVPQEPPLFMQAFQGQRHPFIPLSTSSETPFVDRSILLSPPVQSVIHSEIKSLGTSPIAATTVPTSIARPVSAIGQAPNNFQQTDTGTRLSADDRTVKASSSNMCHSQPIVPIRPPSAVGDSSTNTSFFSTFLFGEPQKSTAIRPLPVAPSQAETMFNQGALDPRFERRFFSEPLGWSNAWTAKSTLSNDVHAKLFGEVLGDRRTMILDRAKMAYHKLSAIMVGQSFAEPAQYHTLVQLHRMMNDMFFEHPVDIRELYEILAIPGNGFHCIHHPHQGWLVIYSGLGLAMNDNLSPLLPGRPIPSHASSLSHPSTNSHASSGTTPLSFPLANSSFDPEIHRNSNLFNELS